MLLPRRLYTLSRFFQDTLGSKVRKIPVDAGFSCPNLDGTVGTGGCAYCANRSFSPAARRPPQPLAAQIEGEKARLRRRGDAPKFLVYFQPYTNTYASLPVLRRLYEEALSVPEVVGLCVGTRPDCVPDPVLDLLEAYARAGYHVWLEYGLQSAHQATLARINRGHDFACFADAVRRAQGRGIYLGVHLILGLPGETPKMMRETAHKVATLGLDGVKLHHLYLVEGTRLAEEWQKEPFPLPDPEQYVQWACDVLELFPPRCAVHRVCGEVLGEGLIAPRWGVNKPQILARIEAELARRNSAQGARFTTGSVPENNPFGDRSAALTFRARDIP